MPLSALMGLVFCLSWACGSGAKLGDSSSELSDKADLSKSPAEKQLVQLVTELTVSVDHSKIGFAEADTKIKNFLASREHRAAINADYLADPGEWISGYLHWARYKYRVVRPVLSQILSLSARGSMEQAAKNRLVRRFLVLKVDLRRNSFSTNAFGEQEPGESLVQSILLTHDIDAELRMQSLDQIALNLPELVSLLLQSEDYSLSSSDVDFIEKLLTTQKLEPLSSYPPVGPHLQP